MFTGLSMLFGQQQFQLWEQLAIGSTNIRISRRS